MEGINILLGEKELKYITNKILGKENVSIKAIKFLKDNNSIEVKISIKKFFSVDIRGILKLKNIKGDYITLELMKLAALKVDLFSVLEKTIGEKNIEKLKNKGIIIDGRIIEVNSKRILKVFNLDEGKFQNINIEDNGLLIGFMDINKDKLLFPKEIG